MMTESNNVVIAPSAPIVIVKIVVTITIIILDGPFLLVTSVKVAIDVTSSPGSYQGEGAQGSSKY